MISMNFGHADRSVSGCLSKDIALHCLQNEVVTEVSKNYWPAITITLALQCWCEDVSSMIFASDAYNNILSPYDTELNKQSFLDKFTPSEELSHGSSGCMVFISCIQNQDIWSLFHLFYHTSQ